jgi:phosphoglycerol transferase MdoB-like AlkP superfamily enzyme
MAGVSIICIRGGLQRTPMNRASAVEVAEGSLSQIVLNTPYSIISTLSNTELAEHKFYTQRELKKYINPVKEYNSRPFRNKNVVIIILESFSKQFTGQGKFKSFTPFLDSLALHSFVCRNAYANALHSAEGIPAIVAGIPSLMEEPITTSQYGINRVSALPGLLKQMGYSSSFYHGGSNGTMAFDQFARNAGYEKYYGRSEYDNDKDYDGNWGIWDEPFLQYFANGLKKTKQPFISTVFTLTSHDPFEVPEAYKKTLPQGPLKIHQSIAYTDMALRKFFQTVSKEAFYRNTLFVLVADHCSLQTQDENDHNNMGFYRIPLIFVAPGDTTLRGGTDELAQQVDIVPSVLDYLGYNKKFFAFGNSIFSPYANRMVVNELNNTFQFVSGNYIFKTTDLDVTGVFNFPKDFKCWNNLVKEPEGIEMKNTKEPYFKAYLQLYNYSLIHNKMTVEK